MAALATPGPGKDAGVGGGQALAKLGQGPREACPEVQVAYFSSGPDGKAGLWPVP